jgi:hypothetical protein
MSPPTTTSPSLKAQIIFLTILFEFFIAIVNILLFVVSPSLSGLVLFIKIAVLVFALISVEDSVVV